MGTILNLFNIKATYTRYKSKQLVYSGPKCQIVIENLEIKGITYNQQDLPSPEEIKNLLNKAVREITQQVSAEFGF
ncbi:hypothetical protein [Arcicella lustrica]|uniref:Uncharacterized protein n=1 Tax=Arcicella lustrica TaxID=2984196 RepID=A0ABU5SDP2_9BACT|nr:hypothetical protein [Arcicella sp. DC25W]MEA5425399.1 hypothetical protein [Arcicella sp. DC25W]